MGLISELRRRNVFRVAIAYVVIAWVILEAGDVLAPALHLPEWVVSALVFFVVLGFPLALVFAWAFELTSEGIKFEKHVDRGKSITHLTGRKLDFFIIGILTVALVLLAFDNFVLDPSRDAELLQATADPETAQLTTSVDDEPAANTIAVLAFADLSPEGDQQHFSDGVSEEILNALAHVKGLRVTSRSSAFSFRGGTVDIPTVAEQLGVAHVLEGSVRKAGNTVRITAQLIDTRTDTHVWSATYDRELEDIFAVQNDIAVAIVGSLREHLGKGAKATPRMITAANVDAHEAYLRGHHLLAQRGGTEITGAIRELEKAVALDPDYALAHAELAIATLLSSRQSYGDLTVTEVVVKAAPHVKKAMELDPGLAEAHAAAGFLSSAREKPEEALGHYEQAIHINPNYADVYIWMGRVYWDVGRYKEVFTMDEMAVRLDPLSNPANVNYLERLIDQMRLNEAAAQVEKMVALWPSYTSVYYPSWLSSLGGNWADLIMGRLGFLNRNPQSSINKRRLTLQFALIGLEQEVLAWSEYLGPLALRWLGRNEDAVTLARTRLAKAPESLAALNALGLALASVGDYEHAQPILEESWQRNGERVSCCQGSVFPAHSAVALMLMRQGAGEHPEVAELATAIRNNVRHYNEAGVKTNTLPTGGPSPDYEKGLAAYFTGDHEEGLAQIAKAVDEGFFFPPREAYLQALYDDPGFAPIRATQEARQKRERERFLAIVCTDNPFAAVWQPAEGTCEKYAPTGGW